MSLYNMWLEYIDIRNCNLNFQQCKVNIRVESEWNEYKMIKVQELVTVPFAVCVREDHDLPPRVVFLTGLLILVCRFSGLVV